ncbi:Double-stranded RNA-binding protein 1 [Citrus sinensis]|uniref:Double-stranded RNA-binding protein 1 n=1 Tax=Citrus sinensis TaxID=2711 RepID=A0ACB8MGM7_CITSI|nr:Double-stranded RNA-binding protein 1 [Citrus sinensis]
MYKTKLQELCHQRVWNLPVYTTAKQGLDHNPRFQATVTVNDQSFTTPDLYKSSKEAQNDAARIAFQHFSSPPPPSSTPAASSSNGSSSESAVQVNARETDRTTQVNATISTVNDVHKSRDMQHLYKNQLQSYTQKKNLPLPMYSCEREGPPHASRFKCKDDSVLYKNLLQELAQKEAYALPVYNTKQSGESHAPTFVSTVEVGGQVFSGQEAKSKKQAEMSAAKVAYMRLKEPNPSQGPALVSPAIQAQADYSSSSLQSNVTADLHHNVQTAGRMVFNPNSMPKVQAEEIRELTTVNTEVAGYDLSQFPQPEFSSSSDLSASSGVEKGMPSSSLPLECTVDPRVDPIAQSVRADGRTCKIIRVRPNRPNMKFPEGSSVLHRDNQWVAWTDGSQSN